MKACPHCEAELRDSVIRCTRCGRSLRDEPEPAAPVSAPASEWSGASSVFAEPPDATVPSPAWTPPGPEAWASLRHEAEASLRHEAEAGPRHEAETSLGHEADASLRHAAEEAPSSPFDPGDRRALPTERRGAARPDFVLLLSAVAAVAVGVLAWRAVAEPWVRLVITDASEPLDPVLVGRIVLPGRAALVGTIAQALAVGLGGLGLLWFLFGVDRGWTMPWFANPALGVAAALVGLVAAGLSGTVWFVWEDAAVAHSSSVGMGREKLQELLDLQPAPLVQIVRLPGLVRFGALMGIGLVAASAAWWASHKRA